MRNIKLILEYDGSDLCGFQRQNGHGQRTVQSELEAALQKLFHKKINIVAAGRTDSGVHAEAQVVNFRTDSKIDLPKIQFGLNRYLPRDISVVQIKNVSSSFNSQRSAKRKIYEYRVFNSHHRSPLERTRSFFFPYSVDFLKMKKAARLLCGRRDFRIFESTAGRRKTSIRTIYKFEVKKKESLICFTVEADGFLYKMVRSMVGTLLSVGAGKISLSEFKELIVSGQRHQAGPTAPSEGLTLKKVVY